MNFPGFVDLQVNGYLNADFSNEKCTEKSVIDASRKLLAHGTAAFLPTVITSSEENYRRNLPIVAKVMQRDEFKGRILGIHVEGPFISPKPGAVGAHNPAWVKAPDIAFFDQMQEWAQGNIKLMTIAAENEGAAELAEHALARGVTVSLGHQWAEEKDLQLLASAGAKALTHFGNGIPNMIPRHPNPLWAGLAEERLTAMMIGDGHHLPPQVLKATILAKGLDNVVIVSDASPLAGMPPGRYETLGNLAVLEENGYLHNPEKQCLVGSSATILECVNYLDSLGFWSVEALRKLAFYNPLKLIGISPDKVSQEPMLSYEKGKGFKIL
jgi:N-acetylglucosamine-6-phosphate deacetylase